MTIRRRKITALAVLLVVGLAGCSSDSGSDGSQSANNEQAGDGEAGDGNAGDGDAATEMDPGFDAASLPDDFPPELMPDSFTAGMYAELGDIRNVNFEITSSFDDAVAEYTAKIGEEPTIVEAEERLASWTVDVWQVSIIEGSPTIIGVATAG